MILRWTAGQDREEPFGFFADGEKTPLDLTGAEVVLVVVESYSDTEPWQVFRQDTHANAAAGKTTLEVDLSSVPTEWMASGKRLVATLWVIDSVGQRTSWGNYAIEIEAAAQLPPEGD